MALATAKKSPRRTSTTGRSAASTKRASSRAPAKPPVSFIVRMYRNPAGKVLLILAAIILIIGIDFLVTLNHFERFFIVLGIEWIIATLVGWILFVFRDRIKNGN